MSVTHFEDLRARYDALPSSEHLRDHLPDTATLETVLGPMRVERSALLALSLDDLYSARWRGDAVCDAVRRASPAARRYTALHGPRWTGDGLEMDFEHPSLGRN